MNSENMKDYFEEKKIIKILDTKAKNLIKLNPEIIKNSLLRRIIIISFIRLQYN